MSDWKALLLEHAQHYPVHEPRDLIKFLHQSFMGPGHLIPSTEWAQSLLEKEWTALAPSLDIPLSAPLGNDLFRLNLNHCKAIGLSTKSVSALFFETSRCHRPDPEGLRQALDWLEHSSLSSSALHACLADYERDTLPPVSHSPSYRAAYSPSYRVVHGSLLSRVPLLASIDRALDSGQSVRIALDGPCASGKTTLGHWLADLYRCPLNHMDDFFLPPHLRTPQRLAQPGGNVDHERFDREVLTPLCLGETARYRPWNCSTGGFDPERTVLPGPIFITEGSYSLRPDLRGRYTHRVWVEADWELRRSRLLSRGGPEVMARYLERWIPLEDGYFHACQVKKCCSFILSSSCPPSSCP